MRKTETIVKKDLAHFLPHMSAALGLFIALQTEAALWFAIEGEYRPEGSWNIYSLAVASWLSLSHSHCVQLDHLYLVVMAPSAWLSEETQLFLLFTWVVKEKYRLLKPRS